MLVRITDVSDSQQMVDVIEETGDKMSRDALMKTMGIQFPIEVRPARDERDNEITSAVRAVALKDRIILSATRGKVNFLDYPV